MFIVTEHFNSINHGSNFISSSYVRLGQAPKVRRRQKEGIMYQLIACIVFIILVGCIEYIESKFNQSNH